MFAGSVKRSGWGNLSNYADCLGMAVFAFECIPASWIPEIVDISQSPRNAG